MSSMLFVQYARLLLMAGTIGLLGCLIVVIYRGIETRRRMLKFRTEGLSFVPSHPVLGSLNTVKDVMAELPQDVNPQYMPMAIRQKYPHVGNVFYFDTWPFVEPILITASPSAARQVTQEHSLPKWPALRNFFGAIAGTYDLITMEGLLWKKWRGVFNPGFGATYLATLVPEIVTEALVLQKLLESRAGSGDMFQLKPLTDNFTVDVIGKMVLNVSLNSQTTPHPIITTLRRQIQWLSTGTELNLWQRWHPVRPFMHWYNTRIMNSYVNKVFDERFKSYIQQPDQPSNKSIIDRSIHTYLNDVSGASSIKLFMFSGHDTTSASVCYSFYLLSKSPLDLKRIRAEHDEVFGLDLARAPTLITEDPHILNRLPFTLAVIKETLRLFPIASSTRMGEPGFSVVVTESENDDGSNKSYPTDKCLVWTSPHLIQRSPDFWPRADDFVPQRWLVQSGHELYPVKGAWRPFEFGPRNCIGQELALLEMKLVLALVIRSFEFSMPYDEWDKMHPRKEPKHVAGERAYQAMNGGPSEGMPCRVKLRGT